MLTAPGCALCNAYTFCDTRSIIENAGRPPNVLDHVLPKSLKGSGGTSNIVFDLTIYTEYENSCGAHTTPVFTDTSGTGLLTCSCSSTQCTIVVPTDSARYSGATLGEFSYTLLIQYPHMSKTYGGTIAITCT